MANREENIVEMANCFAYYRSREKCDCLSWEEYKDLTIEAVDRFEKEHRDVSWYELSYYDEIDSFGRKFLAKELWKRLEDVPMNPETEKIEEEWNGFSIGTLREDIWHWFEETFSVSVATDMMGIGERSVEFE